jgi:hypothetical protein
MVEGQQQAQEQEGVASQVYFLQLLLWLLSSRLQEEEQDQDLTGVEMVVQEDFQMGLLEMGQAHREVVVHRQQGGRV